VGDIILEWWATSFRNGWATSPGISRPGELLAPIDFKDTVYRVVVTLDRTSVTAYGEQRALTPGMTLTADVVTDRRHFIDWVLDPLKAIHAQGE